MTFRIRHFNVGFVCTFRSECLVCLFVHTEQSPYVSPEYLTLYAVRIGFFLSGTALSSIAARDKKRTSFSSFYGTLARVIWRL
jgi:hypothetical protein